MHAPATNGQHFFDSPKVEALIQEFRETGRVQVLDQIVIHSEPLVSSLIRSHALARFDEHAELCQVVFVKLARSIKAYDPSKGSAYTFIWRLSMNMIKTCVTRVQTHRERYTPIIESPSAWNTPDTHMDADYQHGLEDVCFWVRKLKTTCTDDSEKACQRWYIESLIEGGFDIKRCVCASAAEVVWGLSHHRSRFLYDITILEVRRVLWDRVPHPHVDVRSLRGTRELPLVGYAVYLGAEEFSRLVHLMRGLAPFLISQIEPRNSAAVARRDETAIRENLELILWGSPDATPLFPTD